MPNNLDLTFKTLADPTRRAVLIRLTSGPAPVTDLAAPFDMALPSFMQHVRLLEDAGLVTTQKQGRTRICSLEPDALTDVENWLSRQRSAWNARFDRLETYLDGETSDDA
ncbi:MAG: helix-turn-helix transcriptional regulator [Rhizobiales bacterium]|nr:helix-turn-helix transcriptional regulator [Hyphomicrobiales bacterium]MBO6700119.1 helix-turn-helix transcriptional regulator [Hyphomicrobiales bacterium]MBO6737716.1 helix-turn-helix transcriptional regulator [Hyphomicrobiales bacterium]MBO6913227.1 helix-turn-helix transcriptional regulator [Hyphomicrobiales bacterium]MBO6954271.1 helix-turn-helix transcriptional regulator [Hyphomicrobiales bacterium]